MLIEDETIKEKFVKPVKRRAYPIIFGGVFFNFIILTILIIMIFKVNEINNQLTSILK